jgi:hypothetical protein
VITAYRLGYCPPDAQAPQDQGIRASDVYVAAHDPLRARVGGADVALGVDPGTYFCGGLAHWLAERNVRGGFVHIPPGDHHTLTHAVVMRLLEALGPAERVLVTGFGPFPGVAWNPSGAYAASLSHGRVLRLEGAHDMAPVVAQLGGDWDVILALGVDSRQRLARPRYTIETQTRGMGEGGAWLPCEGLARAVLESGVFTTSCR